MLMILQDKSRLSLSNVALRGKSLEAPKTKLLLFFTRVYFFDVNDTADHCLRRNIEVRGFDFPCKVL